MAPTPVVHVEIPKHLSQPIGTPGTRLLQIERSKASFSSEALKQYLHGNERIEQLSRMLPILENEPAFNKAGIHYMGRSEKYRYGLAKEKRMVQLQNELNWSPAEVALADELIGALNFS